MGKWLAGIAATVISALIIWYLQGRPGPARWDPAPPPPPKVYDPSPPPPKAYDPYAAFIAAATSSDRRNPMADQRISQALRLALRGEDPELARRMMFEAGYPNGFSLEFLLSRFKAAGGNEPEADILIAKVQNIGVQVRKVP